MSTKNQLECARSGIWSGLHPGMSIASKGMVIAFVVFTVLNVDFAGGIYKTIRTWIESTLNWYYVTVVCVMLFACLYLMFSRFGSVRLGDDDSKPEFSYFSWFSMLFSAGVGIGLLFWSIAEPIYHFQGNPFIDQAGVMPQSEAAAVVAMRVTYFHWGFHGWAVYVLVALCLAYFGFRKKLPLTLRSALHPIIGDKIYGPLGHAVDLLAVFGTVFGVATSLGLGVSQMGAGLNYLFGLDNTVITQVVLIAVISLLATVSAVSGVGKGIRIISEWNIWLSVILILAFLFYGPTKYLISFYLTTFGDYLWNAIPMGFWTAGGGQYAGWQGGWTIFYWGWWISWAPFVGMFIARISRGRTIREFMFGAMFVPTSIAFLWLAIFGGSALHLELFEGYKGMVLGGDASSPLAALIQPEQGVIAAVNEDISLALYRTIELMGFGWLEWIVAALSTFLIATWFITSSDSGTLVITTMLSMGDENPPQRFRIVWGVGEGVVAAVLLLAGGLGALQTAAIAAALPVSVIMLLMTWGVIKSLSQDSSAVPAPSAPTGAAPENETN